MMVCTDWIARAAGLALALATTAALAGEIDCGSLQNGYGPFDWTNPVHRRDKIPIVTSAHFTDAVKSLSRGATSAKPGADLDYTLRAIPNHHEALYVMAQYGIAEKTSRPPGTRWTVECYFDRAKRFKPDDGVVYMIEGIYLHKLDRHEEALKAYEQAVALSDSPEVHYNLGLLYLDMKRYEDARRHARAAYEKNYPLTGLRRKLQAAGHWGG